MTYNLLDGMRAKDFLAFMIRHVLETKPDTINNELSKVDLTNLELKLTLNGIEIDCGQFFPLLERACKKMVIEEGFRLFQSGIEPLIVEFNTVLGQMRKKLHEAAMQKITELEAK